MFVLATCSSKGYVFHDTLRDRSQNWASRHHGRIVDLSSAAIKIEIHWWWLSWVWHFSSMSRHENATTRKAHNRFCNSRSDSQAGKQLCTEHSKNNYHQPFWIMPINLRQQPLPTTCKTSSSYEISLSSSKTSLRTAAQWPFPCPINSYFFCSLRFAFATMMKGIGALAGLCLEKERETEMQVEPERLQTCRRRS